MTEPGRRPTQRWHLTVIAVVLAAIAGDAPAQRQASLTRAWDASNEAAEETIDHSDWQELLDRYLVPRSPGANRFDYAGLQASARDTAKLEQYLSRLQAVDPGEYSRAEQKAYWINLYNALTVQLVAQAYPVKSIRRISESWFRGLFHAGPWADQRVKIAGIDLSLDDIENGILRPVYADSRIHYGLNCASLGCPDLSPTAFTAANTEELLEAGARSYVNDPRGVHFVDQDRIVISSIYDWYSPDYGGTDEFVIDHLIRYADIPLAERIRAFRGSIGYAYDWNLNEP